MFVLLFGVWCVLFVCWLLFDLVILVVFRLLVLLWFVACFGTVVWVVMLCWADGLCFWLVRAFATAL